MRELVLRIYDWMSGHRWWCLASLAVVTLLMVLSVTRLSYREDIRDFLPLDEKEREALNDYDRQAQTSLIVAIIEQRDSTVDDPDLLVEGVETFLDAIDGLEGVTVQTDFSQMEEQQEETYRQLPYLLEAADYQRMDSLLQQPDFIASRLQEAKERLLMPMGMGSMMENDITHDPLGLFSPVVSLMRDTAMLSRFDIYDGCLLTADHRRALVMLNSPYGGSETASNERLLDLLNTKADSVSRLLTPDSCLLTPSLLTPLTIRFCGAPVIAVTNASQIKADSLLSVCIAAVLILLLLWFFLRSLRHILLIALTIGWGWVFAIACLSWVHQEVSVIVIGISSIIVGIAVNYPLHLIAHLSHTSDVRQALQEIVKPLVVGNITTVGAFLALVPLRAAALRDLGLFSSFLLIGTILFTLIWLPQILLFTSKFTVYSLQFTDDYSSASERTDDNSAFSERTDDNSAFSERLASKSSVNRKLSTVNKNTPLLLAALLLLTAFFGYHSLHTAFDADLTHINYMTPVQRSDMALLQQLMPTDSQRQQELNRRIPTTPETQQARLHLWQSWTSSHRDQLSLSLRDEATRAGFTPDSFDPFFSLLSPASDISPSSFLLPPSSNHPSLFSSIASHLSDDFNYIGWACACIVFFFLWASFRSLPLALLSFLPMAVSWLWILGIMALLGIQFNIINIILSTFIFGQGDDYTIFMTEGTVYEYKHHRPMLASYRRAIILSALIMFIGIGSLIIARHPALHSLAEVTIVGMFSVVLMAFVIPPLAFRLWIRFFKKFV